MTIVTSTCGCNHFKIAFDAALGIGAYYVNELQVDRDVFLAALELSKHDQFVTQAWDFVDALRRLHV